MINLNFDNKKGVLDSSKTQQEEIYSINSDFAQLFATSDNGSWGSGSGIGSKWTYWSGAGAIIAGGLLPSMTGGFSLITATETIGETVSVTTSGILAGASATVLPWLGLATLGLTADYFIIKDAIEDLERNPLWQEMTERMYRNITNIPKTFSELTKEILPIPVINDKLHVSKDMLNKVVATFRGWNAQAGSIDDENAYTEYDFFQLKGGSGGANIGKTIVNNRAVYSANANLFECNITGFTKIFGDTLPDEFKVFPNPYNYSTNNNYELGSMTSTHKGLRVYKLEADTYNLEDASFKQYVAHNTVRFGMYDGTTFLSESNDCFKIAHAPNYWNDANVLRIVFAEYVTSSTGIWTSNFYGFDPHHHNLLLPLALLPLFLNIMTSIPVYNSSSVLQSDAQQGDDYIENCTNKGGSTAQVPIFVNELITNFRELIANKLSPLDNYVSDNVKANAITIYPGAGALVGSEFYPVAGDILVGSAAMTQAGFKELWDNPTLTDEDTDTPVITLPSLIVSGSIAQDKTLTEELPKPEDYGPPIIPPIPNPDYGMYVVYNPSKSTLASFSAWLWGSDLTDITNLSKLYSNPMDSIISLHRIYCTPNEDTSDYIRLGYNNTSILSPITKNIVTRINCGTIAINEYYKNILDYNPYTKIELYLPFIGFVNLDVDKVMNGSINVTYDVNVETGDCVASILLSKGNLSTIIGIFNGNCSVQMPISAGNMYQTILGTALKVGIGIAGAGAGGVAGGVMMAGAVGQIADTKVSVQNGGSLTGSAGELSYKKPYLLITRPVNADANKFNEYYGYTSNNTVSLSSLNGYTKIKDIHLENMSIATQDEIAEIETLLKDGVIF